MHLIQEIGSYAGLAAIPGLAILSALYFSQARDVKRLREWAGRAPERAAEQAAGGRPATQTQAQPARAAQPAAARSAAAGGAAASVAPAVGGGGGTATAAPARPSTGTVTHPPAATPRRITPHIPGSGGGGQTAVLGTAAAAPEPWYRRAGDRLPAGRYVALIVAGVLIVGGGAAYGITQLGSSSTSTSAPGSGQSAAKNAAVTPPHITVAVLNATGVPNLARTVGHKLLHYQFKLGNLNNATGGNRSQSVVMFKPGNNKAAGLVARRLHIDSIQPADAQSLQRAGSATVIVVVGKDKAPSPPPSTSSNGGGTGAGTGGGGTSGGGTATPGAGTGTPATPGAGTGTPGTGGTGTGTPSTGGTGGAGQ